MSLLTLRQQWVLLIINRPQTLAPIACYQQMIRRIRRRMIRTHPPGLLIIDLDIGRQCQEGNTHPRPDPTGMAK